MVSVGDGTDRLGELIRHCLGDLSFMVSAGESEERTRFDTESLVIPLRSARGCPPWVVSRSLKRSRKRCERAH